MVTGCATQQPCHLVDTMVGRICNHATGRAAPRSAPDRSSSSRRLTASSLCLELPSLFDRLPCKRAGWLRTEAGPDRGWVFISYRREDTAPYARLLQYELRERIPGVCAFMDVDSIEPGQNFVEALTRARNKRERTLLFERAAACAAVRRRHGCSEKAPVLWPVAGPMTEPGGRWPKRSPGCGILCMFGVAAPAPVAVAGPHRRAGRGGPAPVRLAVADTAPRLSGGQGAAEQRRRVAASSPLWHVHPCRPDNRPGGTGRRRDDPASARQQATRTATPATHAERQAVFQPPVRGSCGRPASDQPVGNTRGFRVARIG
jgi:TIR domain